MDYATVRYFLKMSKAELLDLGFATQMKLTATQAELAKVKAERDFLKARGV